MQVNCKLSGTALDFIFRIATPLSVASPDLIVSNKKKGKRKSVIVYLPEILNNYLEQIAANFNCSKVETMTSIIEVFAQSGLKIDEVLQVTYLAKKYSRPNAIKLTQAAICAGLLEYLSKQKLSVSDWQIFNDTANNIRGQKRKYTKK